MPEKIYLDLDSETVKKLDEVYGGNLEAALTDRLPANRTSFALKATSILSTLAVVVLTIMLLNLSNQVEGLKPGKKPSTVFLADNGNKLNANVDLVSIEHVLRPTALQMRMWRHPNDNGNYAHKLMMNRGTTPQQWDSVIAAGVDLNHAKKPFNSTGEKTTGQGATVLVTGIMQENWQSVIYLLTCYREKIDFNKGNINGKTAHDRLLQKINNGTKVPQQVLDLF